MRKFYSSFSPFRFAFLAAVFMAIGVLFTLAPMPAHALPPPVHAAVTAAPHPAATPLAPSPHATAAPVAALPSTLSVFTTVAGAGGWVFWHWQGLGALLSLLVAAYAAIRQRQWEALIALAGQITMNVATLSGLDGPAKRKEAEDRLYTMATPLMRRLFSQLQFEHALEEGYQFLTKPKLKTPAVGG